MGIRESLNQNPAVTTGATIGIIVLALVFILYEVFGGSGGGGSLGPNKAFFSVDDGVTYFADDINKPSGFDYNGKPAYRATVYKCKDGKPFVAYLERFTPEAQKKYQALQSSKGPTDPIAMTALMLNGQEMKKPGGKKWVKRSEPGIQDVMSIKCPDGSTDSLEMVVP